MRGIPTMHGGTRYRSLLEAKWAAFFTRLGWKFEYEPFEGNGYIPDFIIYGESPLAVEVKPAVSWNDLRQHAPKVSQGLTGTWDHDILIVGASPVIMREGNDWSIGLIGEANELHLDDDLANQGIEHWFDPGVWSACPTCNQPAVTHAYSSYHRRPCSHYDGCQWTINSQQHEALTAHWKHACNEVQWRGAA